MGAHPARDFDATGFGHLDIQDRDIGFVFLDEGLSLFSISRLGYNLQIACAFEQLADPGSHHVVVVSQKDADFDF
jgi:hypothetical protein